MQNHLNSVIQLTSNFVNNIKTIKHVPVELLDFTAACEQFLHMERKSNGQENQKRQEVY